MFAALNSVLPDSVLVKFPEPARIALTVILSVAPVLIEILEPVIAFPDPVKDPSVNVSTPTVSVSSARFNIPPLTVTAAVSFMTEPVVVVPALSNVKVP